MGRAPKPEPGRRARAVGAYLAAHKKNHTFEQLVAATGISSSNLSDYFGGRKTIDVDQLQAICDVLDLDIITVMRETGP